MTGDLDYVGVDERFYRPAEVELLVGEVTKSRRVLGWQPTYTYPELVTLMTRNDVDSLGQLVNFAEAVG